jgi:hypothetical protein
MSSLSFKLDQVFILLVPFLVSLVHGVDAVNCPSETDFVQNSFSIKSKFVLLMMLSLRANPVA